MAIELTILFDNYLSANAPSGLKPLWGFAAYLQVGHDVWLFDSGSNGRVLLNNAKILNIDLSRVRYFFLSHPHWDHLGGWDTVLELSPQAHFIWPNSASKHLLHDIEQHTMLTVVDQRPLAITDYAFSTGVMQPEGEQALILKSEKGLVIIAGCSHPGIENFILRAKQLFPDEPIHYVIGGFHLLHSSPQQIKRTIQQLDTQYITPTHCTGQLATEMIKQAFGNRFIPGGVGQRVKLPISDDFTF